MAFKGITTTLSLGFDHAFGIRDPPCHTAPGTVARQPDAETHGSPYVERGEYRAAEFGCGLTTMVMMGVLENETESVWSVRLCGGTQRRLSKEGKGNTSVVTWSVLFDERVTLCTC
jgi:hypothetical protein